MPINATHNPDLRSWVESANDPASDFPMQNLPLGAILQWDHQHGHHHSVPCVAIGDSLLNLGSVAGLGFLRSWDRHDEFERAIRQSLHGSVAIEAWHNLMPDLRLRLQDLLRHDAPAGSMVRRQREQCLHPRATTQFIRPFMIENYTDFYASKHHAANVGAMFRPDNPLLPNYTHVPIGYHGRASSIGISGSLIRRPKGQTSPPETDPSAGPGFGPSAMLDYEAEMGLFISRGNKLGDSIPIDKARDHIFGLCLVNDWSARDIQKWEYQPLGPFLAKNFGTTISPLVVSLEALEPFRTAGPARDAADPVPLPYLTSPPESGFDITVEVHLLTEQMREKSLPPHRLSRGNMKDLYWTIDQLVAHHAVNGCNLRNGDLLATGTISGTAPESRGCLLELTWDGIDPATKKPRARKPIQLPTGESRLFLADEDEVIMTAYCEKPGFRRIGFGECRGRIKPAAD